MFRGLPMLAKPLSEMTEEEILLQIEEMRNRRMLARQKPLKEKETEKLATVKIPKTKADTVTGELSDILGRLLDDTD